MKKISNSFVFTLWRAIYLFSAGLFFLAAYYFIIVRISIGQDMLMQAAEQTGAYIWTIVSILIWMLFSWFSSRLIADEYIKKTGVQHTAIFRHFPRLLGYNVGVCLQLAILNLPTVAALSKGLFVLLLAHNLFYFLLNYTFEKKETKWYLISALVAIGYIVYLVIKYPTKIPLETNAVDADKHLRGSFYMILIFFILQIAFVWFVIWRRKRIDSPWFIQYGKKWFIGYSVFAGLVFILYAAIILSGTIANMVGAIAVTVLAFGLWVGFICLLQYFSLILNIRFGLLLLTLATVWGLYLNDPYKVRLQDTTARNLYNNRDSIDHFFTLWTQNPVRKAAIDSAKKDHPFPVYFILADGGASKSGYWVASVLSKLEDSSAADNRFSAHLFSLAGASGGSVGNAAFYALLKKRLDAPGTPINDIEQTSKFFESDFLSASFARFLGPDLVRHIFPFIVMDDRAAVLEQSMENNPGSEIIGSYFSKSIDSVYDHTGTLPALFINTTSLQSGAPGVVSSIKLDSQVTERIDILRLLDTATDLNKGRDIRLSTAVVLGARFPYISPAGELSGKYFVDGGYFDNSGAGVTLEILQYIERKMNDSANKLYPKFKDKLAFKIIYISNGGDKSPDHALNPFVNDLAAPLLTVLGTYGMQTNLTNNKLAGFMKNARIDTAKHPFEIINLPMDKQGIDTVSYPMNWVISKYNLYRMKTNLDSVHVKEILE